MIRLSHLDRSKIKPTTREEHLARIAEWQEAQRKLEAVCKELGIEVPIMIAAA